MAAAATFPFCLPLDAARHTSKVSGLFRRQVGKAVAAARIDAGVIIDTVDDCFLYIDWHFSQPPYPFPPAFPPGALLRNVATFAN